ncbi:glucose dehydrogenase [Acuticoccus kandeliae]|uniref:glucose dehydrogenase n=1 Tax=Acuticoccus kandeliae TaxID=2073160 RepID=UPI000D3E4DB9|nr:glucose dehydrogenase [Acuticoccus kandeliae]
MTYRHDTQRTRGVGHWVVMLLALVIGALGVVLAAGGAYLIALGGSWYYAPAGLGLIATAVLLARRDISALYIYLLVWIGTLGWAYWEAGLDWWAQVPRVVAPTVLLVLVLLATPALGRRPSSDTHEVNA